MAPTADTIRGADVLIERLEQAVARGNPNDICRDVTRALRETVLELPDELLAESRERYARRLVHRCSDGTYSVMVMVWAPGQGTPVHDHAGKWCVECVHAGEIEITSFRPVSDVAQAVVDFEQEGVMRAGPGDVGVLVPPNEYHRIRNRSGGTAVTVHVYAGEMLWCHAFHDLGGGKFKKRKLDLKYTQ